MTHSADHAEIAEQARRIYAEQLVKGLPAMVNSLAESARQLLDKPSEHARLMRRRELVHELKKGAAVWHKTMVEQPAQRAGWTARPRTRPADLPPPGSSGPLSLVDDDTIEREILTSRLALAVMDRAASEFTDLRARMSTLERREELDAAGHAACPRAGAHRRRCLALGRLQPGQLARAAARPARGAGGAGRGGLPRDQPLAGRAGRAARCGPASLHQALAQRADAVSSVGRSRRWGAGYAHSSGYGGVHRPGQGPASGLGSTRASSGGRSSNPATGLARMPAPQATAASRAAAASAMKPA